MRLVCLYVGVMATATLSSGFQAEACSTNQNPKLILCYNNNIRFNQTGYTKNIGLPPNSGTCNCRLRTSGSQLRLRISADMPAAGNSMCHIGHSLRFRPTVGFGSTLTQCFSDQVSYFTISSTNVLRLEYTNSGRLDGSSICLTYSVNEGSGEVIAECDGGPLPTTTTVKTTTTSTLSPSTPLVTQLISTTTLPTSTAARQEYTTLSSFSSTPQKSPTTVTTTSTTRLLLSTITQSSTANKQVTAIQDHRTTLRSLPSFTSPTLTSLSTSPLAPKTTTMATVTGEPYTGNTSTSRRSDVTVTVEMIPTPTSRLTEETIVVYQPTTASHKPTIPSHQLTTSNYQPTTPYHQVTTAEHKASTTDHQLTTTDHQPTIPSHTLTTSDYQPTTPYHQVTTAEHKAATTDHQLTTAEHKAATTDRQLTTTEHQATTAGHQYTSNGLQPFTKIESTTIIQPLGTDNKVGIIAGCFVGGIGIIVLAVFLISRGRKRRRMRHTLESCNVEDGPILGYDDNWTTGGQEISKQEKKDTESSLSHESDLTREEGFMNV